METMFAKQSVHTKGSNGSRSNKWKVVPIFHAAYAPCVEGDVMAHVTRTPWWEWVPLIPVPSEKVSKSTKRNLGLKQIQERTANLMCATLPPPNKNPQSLAVLSGLRSVPGVTFGAKIYDGWQFQFQPASFWSEYDGWIPQEKQVCRKSENPV